MASIKFTGTMSAAQIDLGIKSLSNRGKKFDADVQSIGLSIMAHTDATGDYTKACALYHALPAGTRRSSLVAWFILHSKVQALDPKNPDDKARIEAGSVFKFAKERTTDLEGAAAKMWHEHGKKDTAPSDVFDARAACNSLIARVKAASKAGKRVEGATDPVMAALAALESALKEGA